MPMEAQVRPLPSELTTPPVTKMCLVCLGAEEAGKGGPSWGGARRRTATILPDPPRPGTREGASGGRGGAEHPARRDEALVILVGVHANGGLVDQADGHPTAGRQGAELLQLLDPLHV